jgi:sodium/pantothenate symporter
MTKGDAIHAHPATLLALVLFTLVSLGLGVVANRATSRKAGFLRKYFLGNRSLGAFAVALTAAVMSGGTFMGFPSLVYSFGWVVGLWIASYMVAPLTVLGVLGKRIGQLSRKTGAITLPDLFRERFGSPALGLLTSLVIMVFLTVNLVPQFKAGALILKLVLPARSVDLFVTEHSPASADVGYYLGLLIFTATVVFYTTYGGFLAAIWTDVFQSLVMAVGVIILLPLAMAASGGLERATQSGMEQAGAGFAFGPGAGRAFHPWTLAVSFFLMWAITGMGQPSTLVRLMAFRDARTLRYAMLYLTVYNALIYIPLIFIFVAARGILPGLASSAEVMPRLVITLANPYVAGLILAAPYGAVMSTVSGFLLIIASGLVRDIYQRFLRPRASEREVAWASYAATVAVGLVVATVALNPPNYLQLLVVFASTGMAAAFLVPALLGAFWRRATAAGALAAMATGSAVTLGLYLLGSAGPERLHLAWLFGPNPEIGAPSAFRPYYLLGFDPCVWGLGSSLLA